MSATPAKFSLSLKIGLVLAVLAGGIFAALQLLRPVVDVTRVVGGPALDAKPGNITVEPEYSMDLKGETGGRVLEKNFTLDPGKKVEKGDVLAQFDTADLQLEIAKDQEDYDAAKQRIAVGSAVALELETSREDLANAVRLNRQGGVSDDELAKQRRATQTLEEKLKLEEVANRQELANDENALAVEKRKLDKMTIRAPFEGVVSDVYAHPGDLMGAGAPIATLITTSRAVEGKISEEDFANIRVGQQASVIFLPYGDTVYDATVTKILPTADPETQRHIVHLDVKIDPEKLVPGITGEVSIVVGRHQAQAVVPRRALFGDDLYVVRDGRVELRKIRKGFVWQKGVEIVDGLSPGEEIIVDGIDRVSAGDRVRVREIPPDAAN
jgi:RND family efflux transporter MFP subunit